MRLLVTAEAGQKIGQGGENALSGRKQNFRLFFSYFFSYLIILALPLVALSFFFFGILTNQFNDLQKKISQQEVVQMGSAIDMNIQRVLIMPLSFESDLNFSDQLLDPDDPLQQYLLRADIAEIGREDNFISHLFFYPRNSSSIFSRNAVYAKSYFETRYPEVLADQYNLMELLESGTQNLVVPGVQLESSEEKYLLFFFPIPPENPYAKSGLIVTVSEKNLQKMAGEKNDTLKTVIISDEKHQEIYRSGSYAGSLEDLEKNARYSVFSYHSDQTNWNYFCIYDSSYIEALSNQLSLMFSVLIILLVLAGSMIIGVLMRKYTMPVLHLYQQISRRFFPDNSRNNRDLNGVFEQMSSAVLDVDHFSSRNQLAIQDYLLGRLLNGRYETCDEFNQVGRDIGLSIHGSCFCVLIMRLSMPIADMQPYRQAIEQAEFPSCRSYVRMGNSNDSLITVLEWEETPDDTQLESAAEHIRTLSCFNSFSAIVGLGNPVDNIKDIPVSYNEAFIAVEFGIPCRVNRYSALCCQMKEDVGPLLTRLEIYLVNQNFNNFAEHLNLLAENDLHLSVIQMKVWAIRMMPYLCYHANDLQRRSVYRKLSGTHTIHEIVQIMTEQLEPVSQQNRPTPEQGPALDAQVYQYIVENYMDPNLSVASIAAHFEKSVSYLCRYYKQQRNMTILDTINTVKLNRAKYLLITSDISVGEIASLLNYGSDSSFIRMFRQNCGISPGQFRSENLEEKNT